MKTKNILITDYRYNILITNLPNYLKKDIVIDIARRVLQNKIYYSYTMIMCDYSINPKVIYTEEDYKYYKDYNNSIMSDDIDFIVDYNDILDDESFQYIFQK